MMRRIIVREKRAISEIITLVMIILLVLVAVSVIWQMLQKFIKGAGREITSKCLTMNLAIREAIYNQTTNNVVILVERTAGEGKINGLKFLIFNDNNENVVKSPVETDFPDVLEAKKYTITNITSLPSKIQVAAVVKVESDEEKVCDPSDATNKIKQAS